MKNLEKHMNKPKIGIVGLGIMSRGMADNFLKNDYEIVIWNRTDSVCDPFVSRGATKATSIADVVASSDVIFEVTANDESAREVWLSENGIVASAKPSQTLITSATLSADMADELAKACADNGLTFFDMPLTGGRVAAEAGSLTMLAGGNEAKLDDIRPYLEAIAGDVKYFGKAGNGMRYKLILNGLQALHVAGFASAIRTAKDVGLDPKQVGAALAERPGGVLTNWANESLNNPPTSVTFSVEWITKDLRYRDDLARDELIEEIIRQYETLIQNGKASDDWMTLVTDA